MDEYGQPCPGPLPDGIPRPSRAGEATEQVTGCHGLLPESISDADLEWAEYVAWLDREMTAGRNPEPEIWPPESWEAGDPEPRDSARPRFGQGDEADVLPPGQLLAGLTETVVRDVARLSDDELIGVLQGTRRQIAREQYKQVLVTAEFGRRRQAAFQDAAARGVPVGCRPGGFPGEELAIELVTTRAEAGHRIDDAIDLTTRLPKTLAAMAAGQIDETRAGWIAMYTRSLTPADAARADEVLADAAPDLRAEQLARKAAALEMKLAPEEVRARKEHAKRNDRRVEARREVSGNASLSGREMDTADVVASKAYLDAIAVRLRSAGLPGSLGTLRVLALADLTQGRNPLDRLNPAAAPDAAAAPDPVSPSAPAAPLDPATPAAAVPGPGAPQPQRNFRPGRDDGDVWDDDADDPACDDFAADDPHDSARDSRDTQGRPAPMPAVINLIVPVGTLLGWSAAPAQAGRWGILDRDETRAVVDAASQHPRTRWCVTLVTAPDGTALAHACARGQHSGLLSGLEPQPPPGQLAGLLHRLNLVFTPIATDACDHGQAEDHYTPSRKLRHLVRARTGTCDAPGCQAEAVSADLDHTTPWPVGATEQCNLAPRCRTHHRAKQAPDWQAEQVRPGITRWTLPSGRTHITTATRYDT